MAASAAAVHVGSSLVSPREFGSVSPKGSVGLRIGNAAAVRSGIFGSRLREVREGARRARSTVGSLKRWPTGFCLGRNGHDEEQGKSQPSLADNCRHLQHCFFEICVENMGRPAGTALHEFVGAAVNAYLAGHTRDKLSLQLAYGDSGMEEFRLEAEGYRLTASEERYRTQWLDTIYTTLQMLRVVDNQASRYSPVTVDADPHLFSIVRRVVEGQMSGDEQSFVKFDRGLATKGASGGAVAAKGVIAPQFIPLTQLVLLTMKVANEKV